MKKTILSMALCLTLILSGCAQRGGESSEPSSNVDTPPVQTSNSSYNADNPLIGDGSSAQAEENGDEFIPITVGQADWSSIQGKISGIYSAGGSKVLVFADQMSLYDLAAGKIAAFVTKPDLSYIRVLALDNGYAVIGQTSLESSSVGFVQTDSGPAFHAAIYDKNLVLKSEVELSKLVADGEFLMAAEAIAVSPDGNHIAFATMQGITFYDLQSQKRSKLIDLTGEDEKAYLGIAVFEQIGFTNNGKSMAFKAQSFDVPVVLDKPSFDTVGIVNIDGSGLTNKKPDGYSPKMLISYPNQLLVAEDFKTASGRMMVMDPKTGEQKIQTLTDKNEGGNIYGSDTGRYFASSVPSKTGWIVRVYETDTGKLVKEENISNEGQELYGINDPMICVSDDTKTCMVLLGHKQEAVDTRIASFSF